MPWTLSHPAAVLPLRALGAERLSFAALVLGSMTPDIGYYLPLLKYAEGAHTPMGLFTVCLPAGLVLYLLLQWLSRPVVQLLPAPHRQVLLRLLPLRRMESLGSLWRIVVSVLIGAATHIVWDSFTHADGWFVQRLPVLQWPLAQVNGSELSVYKLLQHVSTLVGGAVLVWAYARWLARVAPQPRVVVRKQEAWRYAVLVALMVLSLSLGARTAVRGHPVSIAELSDRVIPFVVKSTLAMLTLTMLTALLLSTVSREPDLK